MAVDVISTRSRANDKSRRTISARTG